MNTRKLLFWGLVLASLWTSACVIHTYKIKVRPDISKKAKLGFYDFADGPAEPGTGMAASQAMMTQALRFENWDVVALDRLNTTLGEVELGLSGVSDRHKEALALEAVDYYVKGQIIGKSPLKMKYVIFRLSNNEPLIEGEAEHLGMGGPMLREINKKVIGDLLSDLE